MSFLAKLGAIAASVALPGSQATAAMREDAFSTPTSLKPVLVKYSFCEWDNEQQEIEACIYESSKAEEFFQDLKFFVKVTQKELTDKIMVCLKYSDNVYEFMRLDQCIEHGFAV